LSYPEMPLTEFRRDIFTIRARVAAEGFEFLTKTLPKLGKALVSGIEAGQLNVPPEFARKSKGGERWNIPELFSELFLTIFDRQGHLVQNNENAVGFIRQLTQLCYKIETPCTPTQAKAAEDKYKAIESELPSEKETRSRVDPLLLGKARFLLAKLFSGFDPSDVVPRHGPGAVAEPGKKGRKKYELNFYSRSLDQLYPYVHFGTFGVHTQNPADLLGHLDLGEEIPPSKVVFVPKDSRGPRVISCEPAYLQYLQQGLARAIYRLVESHELTRACVHFTNQEHNRRAAMRSSLDGRYATLDLADASDRVSVDLVRLLFPEKLLPYLLATRSTMTRLPSGEVLPLRKFAPMGSALCFPIEALAFWAIAAASSWTVSRGRGWVRSKILVFGDDIIVEASRTERVVAALELFGLKVNRDKCFARGEFRESCGCDAFRGEDVTPVKLRVLRTRDRNRALVDVYRLSKSAMHLFDRGYWKTSEFIWRSVEKVVGKLPTTGPNFPGVSRTSTLLPAQLSIPQGAKSRWNRDLQRVELKTYWLRAKKFVSPFTRDVFRLGHNLIAGMAEPYSDSVADPHTAQPKAGWAPVS